MVKKRVQIVLFFIHIWLSSVLSYTHLDKSLNKCMVFKSFIELMIYNIIIKFWNFTMLFSQGKCSLARLSTICFSITSIHLILKWFAVTLIASTLGFWSCAGSFSYPKLLSFATRIWTFGFSCPRPPRTPVTFNYKIVYIFAVFILFKTVFFIVWTFNKTLWFQTDSYVSRDE